MKSTRWLFIAGGTTVLAALSGCVVAPVGPRYHGHYGYAEPVYVSPPPVLVVPPAPRPPRYRYWR